jgi:hypothetical protein
MERPTAMKTEQAWNGLYCVAENNIISCTVSDITVTQDYIMGK